MSGDVDMRAMVEQIRRMAKLPEDAAKLGAPLVEETAKTFAKAGQDPVTGQTWAVRAKDGARALSGAANKIKATAVGVLIALSVAWPDALHTLGVGHAPQRRIIPDPGSNLPGKYADALKKAAQAAWEAIRG